MIINFKLEDYEDICDTYEKIFEDEDVVDVEIGADDCLVVSTRRIVIPAIQASFREAEWLTRNPDVEEDEDEWETQSSVVVQYELNELDPDKFISYANCDIMYFVEGIRNNFGIEAHQVPQLECYIDTAEFTKQ